MPVPKTSGTLHQFAESFAAYLSREPKDEEERLQIERERKLIHDAFMRMARVEPEPLEPLPPLPPGKARIISF